MTVSEGDVGEFLKAKDYRERNYPGRNRLVVAKVMNIQTVRRYEFYGNGEEVEVDMEDSRGLVATGHLIKAVRIEEEEN